MAEHARSATRSSSAIGAFILAGARRVPRHHLPARRAGAATSSASTTSSPSSPRWAGSSRAPPCGWPACRSAGSPSVVLPPEPGGKVRVTLTIARRFSDRIRSDSEARIVTQGLLGDKLVEITMGSAARRRSSRAASDRARALRDGPDLRRGRGRPREINRLRPPSRHVERIDAAARWSTSPAGGSPRRAVDRLDRAGRSTTSAPPSGPRGASPSRWRRARAGSTRSSTRSRRRCAGSTRSCLDPGAARARRSRGDSAVGVLLSPDSGKAARSLLAAMDALGRGAEKPGAGDGLLSTLLFDPEYKPVARGSPGRRPQLPGRLREAGAGPGPARARCSQDDGDGGLGPGRRRLPGGDGQSPRGHRASQGRGGHGRRAARGPDRVREPRAVPRRRPAQLPAARADPLDASARAAGRGAGRRTEAS